MNYAFIAIFKRWLGVISPFAGSNEFTAKTLYGRNMSALLRTNEAQLSQVRAGVSDRLSCIPTDTTKECVLMQAIGHFGISGSGPRGRPVLPIPVQDGNFKFRNVGLRVDVD